MSDTLVSVGELADELQVRKQRIFKLLPRLGIQPTHLHDPSRGNQRVAVVTALEAHEIRQALDDTPETRKPLSGQAGSALMDDSGYFYLIQLEPALDSGRFKAGFTVDLDGRLAKHRCSAPFASYLNYWPCLRAWERTAIDCVADGAERLHTEVFRVSDIEKTLSKAESFFAVMPQVIVNQESVE